MTLDEGIRYASRDGRNFGKALQLYIDDIPLLVLGTKDDYHNSMLELTLNEEQIPFRRERLCGDHVGPARIGERYHLAGAGHWHELCGEITLGERSDAYGIGADPEHATKWSERHGRTLEVERPQVRQPRPVVERRSRSWPADDDSIPF